MLTGLEVFIHDEFDIMSLKVSSSMTNFIEHH
jgi:hypothetical protein